LAYIYRGAIHLWAVNQYSITLEPLTNTLALRNTFEVHKNTKQTDRTKKKEMGEIKVGGK